MPFPSAHPVAPLVVRFGRTLAWIVTFLAVAWTLAALYFTHPAWAGLLLIVIGVVAWRGRGRAWPGIVVVTALAGGAWLAIPPRNDRAWEPEFARTAWAEVNGDVVTLHDVRNFAWRTEREFTPRWETRTFRLSELRHLDLFMTYWGPRHICHTMVTFDFGAGGRLCVSIEARREVGEPYAAVGGMFRQHELIYIFGDERDLVRVRTSVRPHNDVHLFRLEATPGVTRAMFLDYLRTANALRSAPAWYHTLFTNCSTSIRNHVRRAEVPDPWDWRVLANGHIDERLYDFGYVRRDQPLAELKRRSLITAVAREAGDAPDFSDRIRAGR